MPPRAPAGARRAGEQRGRKTREGVRSRPGGARRDAARAPCGSRPPRPAAGGGAGRSRARGVRSARHGGRHGCTTRRGDGSSGSGRAEPGPRTHSSPWNAAGRWSGAPRGGPGNSSTHTRCCVRMRAGSERNLSLGGASGPVDARVPVPCGARRVADGAVGFVVPVPRSGAVPVPVPVPAGRPVGPGAGCETQSTRQGRCPSRTAAGPGPRLPAGSTDRLPEERWRGPAAVPGSSAGGLAAAAVPQTMCSSISAPSRALP